MGRFNHPKTLLPKISLTRMSDVAAHRSYTMKFLLSLLLALCAVLSVHCAETPCDPSCNCTDLSAYNETVTPPNAKVECLSGQMNVYISKCQLKKSKYDVSNLALLDSSAAECQSKDVLVGVEPQVAFHNPLTIGKCGSTVTFNKTHVVIFNTLHISAQSLTPGIITKTNATEDVSCTYPLEYTTKLNTTLKPNAASAQITVPGGIGTLSVIMALYYDDSFTSAITTDSADLNVESYIYVGIFIPTLEANTFSIKAINITASSGPDGTGESYPLIIAGCPNSNLGVELISVIKNGGGSEARFKMQVFKIASSDSVYIIANVTICPEACEATCNGGPVVKSEDISTGQDVATLQTGVFATQNYDNSGATDSFSKTSALMLLIPSLLLAKLM